MRRESHVRFSEGPGGKFPRATRLKIRSLIPSYTWSTLNSGFRPTAGQSVSATFEFTGGFLGGNVNYFRPNFEYKRFQAMGRGLGGRPNVLAFRFQASHIRGFSGTAAPFFQRVFMGGDFDVRGFDFRSISPIAWVRRETLDPLTGQPVAFDDIAYVGGDTSAVMNLEYRIPLIGNVLSVAPFLDAGNAWTVDKGQLKREVRSADGSVRTEGVRFLAGTNSGIRASTGVEFQIQMPVIQAPFRLMWFYNPSRINRSFTGPATGNAFFFAEDRSGFKFSVGQTF